MTNYKRIIIKVSGESLCGGKFGIDGDSVKKLALQLKKIAELGVRTSVVVGGGNIWRGRTGQEMERSVADNIGMLATVINGLTLGEALINCGVKCKVVSSVGITKVVEQYEYRTVNNYLNEGNLVVFVGGTGLPYFSTDTALSLRACEIHADAIFFMKNIDGIYDSDPKLNSSAKKYDEITYDKVIADNLKAMDMTAIAMCREYGIKSVVLGMEEKDGILRVLKGEKLGTIIK